MKEDHDSSLGDEWEAEIQRRMAEVDAGKVELEAGSEVFERIRLKIQSKSPRGAENGE